MKGGGEEDEEKEEEEEEEEEEAKSVCTPSGRGHARSSKQHTRGWAGVLRINGFDQ
jgi:hypothetical protein